MSIKREVGTLGLLLTAVGSIIGSGWLFGPFFAAQLAGPAAVVAWMIGSVLMMLVALTFTELAGAFPMTGGTVRYMQLSHGPLVGFAMAWISWVSCLVISPVETLALLHYTSSYWPALMHSVNGESVLTGLGFVVAAGLMLILCIINSLSVRQLTKTNTFITSFKLIVPLLTIIAIFSMDFHASNFVSQGFAPQGFKAILAALPAAGIIFSFIGFSNPIQLAGEAKNPQRSLPIAILGAMLICTIIYVLLQIVFIGALPKTAFHLGWQHLNFTGDVGPFAGIAMGVGIIWLAKLLYIDAAISPYGTALVYSGATARLVYAMGQNGYAPKYLMKLNRFSAPMRVIFLNYFLGLLLFLPFPTWQKMMSFLVSAFVFSYAVGPLSLVVLRKTLPDYPRLFRLPCASVLSFIAFYICNLIIYWAGWPVVSKMLIAILAGYAVLLVLKRKEARLNFQFHKSWWIFVYMALIGGVSYLGSFGGRGLIPFGWDFAVVAALSTIVFALALRLGLNTHEAKEELHRDADEEISPATAQ